MDFLCPTLDRLALLTSSHSLRMQKDCAVRMFVLMHWLAECEKLESSPGFVQ